jgi:hypothetical protein
MRHVVLHAIGEAQLPEILIEVDSLTRFSWTLFGRPPRSELELITLMQPMVQSQIETLQSAMKAAQEQLAAAVASVAPKAAAAPAKPSKAA